jgi:hypothetical protein
MRAGRFSRNWRRPGACVSTILLAMVALASCSARLNQAECDRLLLHYVELLVRSDRPDVSGEELARMKREALRKGASDPQFRSCSSEVSRKQYECAIAADNADKLEQCML